MAQQVSLNTLQPENIAHGADILLQAIGPAGTFQTVAEIMAMDYKADDDPQEVPVMGSRRNGTRPGRFKVTGTIKAYWVNQALFSMWLGSNTVSTTGSASIVYGSQRVFNRYNIRVALSANVQTGVTPNFDKMMFVNLTLDQDVASWDKDKLTECSIPFHAEDVIYNAA